MRFNLFHLARKRPPVTGAAEDRMVRRPDEPPQPTCPPCTGKCFQGRACPASPTADSTLVELLTRSSER